PSRTAALGPSSCWRWPLARPSSSACASNGKANKKNKNKNGRQKTSISFGPVGFVPDVPSTNGRSSKKNAPAIPGHSTTGLRLFFLEPFLLPCYCTNTAPTVLPRSSDENR